MQIMKYVPARDGKGRFSKRSVAKFLFVVIALVSLWGNYQLAKRVYVYQCSTGDKFITKNRCNELYQNEADAYAYRNEQMVADNSDLFTNDIQ